LSTQANLTHSIASEFESVQEELKYSFEGCAHRTRSHCNRDHQARSRGLSDRLPLWQIITDFVDEAERNVNANGGWYLEGQPATGHMSARQQFIVN